MWRKGRVGNEFDRELKGNEAIIHIIRWFYRVKVTDPCSHYNFVPVIISQRSFATSEELVLVYVSNRISREMEIHMKVHMEKV